MDVESEQRNIWISFGTLSAVSIFISIIETWKWFSRSTKDVVDFMTILKLIFFVIGMIGSVSVIVVGGFGVYWLFTYRSNFDFLESVTPDGLIGIIRILLIIGFAFKTFSILHLIGQQIDISIFFMDWERSKIAGPDAVSVWRTYFVANEFNEIQTFRRINVPFQVFFVLFFLQGLNFERFGTTQDEIELFSSSSNQTIDYDPIFRTGLGFLVFLLTGIVQYLFVSIFYQRFFEDKIINFVDLCSVSNISIFILDNGCHGYYIHGRSPHGITDVNMKDLLMNFYREESGQCAQRGLPGNSQNQLFIVRTNRIFRAHYDSMLQTYYNFVGPRRTREDHERHTDVLLRSYQSLNSFLCAFVDQSLNGHNYFIRNRYFLEKIFNYEFQIGSRSMAVGTIENLLLIDNERTFTEIFFYGHERSLFFWNLSTFLFVDFLAKDFVLAGIITYLLNRIAVGLRNSYGRRNLSRKTLIPKNFLI